MQTACLTFFPRTTAKLRCLCHIFIDVGDIGAGKSLRRGYRKPDDLEGNGLWGWDHAMGGVR